MSQYGAPGLQLSSVSPLSPVAASSTSSAGGPAHPRPPSARGGGAGPGPGPGPSAGTPSSQSAQQLQQAQHKRVYQACIPCRRRKVRCDLGSVDDPHDPPCVRCRRESKECYFSATRRKRKIDDGPLEEDEQDDYIVRNGRKSLRTAASPPPVLDRRLYSDVPLTPGGSHGRSQPLRRPGDASKSVRSNSTAGEFGNGEPNTPLENLEARSVMRREVYGPHDALDLLYKAATDKSVHPHATASMRAGQVTDIPRSISASHKPDDNPAPVHSTAQSGSHHVRHNVESRQSSNTITPSGYHSRHVSRQDGPTAEQAIDPELTKRDPSNEPGYNEAIKAWGRFRFVRAGWFTAQEAIDYID